MLVADSLGRCESCLCDGVYLFSLQRLSHQQCAPPNMRLKLTGGDRSKGSGVLCAGAHELSFNDTARGGRVARSLSAIR